VTGFQNVCSSDLLLMVTAAVIATASPTR